MSEVSQEGGVVRYPQRWRKAGAGTAEGIFPFQETQTKWGEMQGGAGRLGGGKWAKSDMLWSSYSEPGPIFFCPANES